MATPGLHKIFGQLITQGLTEDATERIYETALSEVVKRSLSKSQSRRERSAGLPGILHSVQTEKGGSRQQELARSRWRKCVCLDELALPPSNFVVSIKHGIDRIDADCPVPAIILQPEKDAIHTADIPIYAA